MIGNDPVTAVGLNALMMHCSEWTFRGSRVSAKEDLLEVIRVGEDGRVQPVVTEVLPLEDLNLGLQDIEDKQNVGRVVLRVD